MAALDIKMILSLVDKASGPARGIMSRFGGKGKAGMAGFAGQANAANGAMMMLNRSVATFAAGAGAYVGFKAMIGGAVEFEAAFTDVQKKVNESPAGFERLRKSILQLAKEMPLAASEIATLVAQAGQFGIANEDLERFAVLGAKASVAFEMGAEESANSLSQMKNALKLNMQQLEDYADAINTVADSTGSSERQLIDFVLRTGPSAMASGMDPMALLAIGSSMTEVGLQASRAGTAVNAMVAKMSKLDSKATTTKLLDKLGGKGYTAQKQKEFFENPTKALTEILKMSKEMARPDRARMFIDLFGLETQDEAAALAGQVDKMVETLGRLGDKTNYLGSVDKTFALFAATTEQQWKQFTQNVAQAAAVFGAKLLPAINDSLKYMNEFFVGIEGRFNIFDRMKAAANGFLNGIGFSGDAASQAMAYLHEKLTALRDLIFGVSGDGLTGNAMGEVFQQWKDFGESLRNSPITTVIETLQNASLGELGGALLAGSLGMTALGVAASVALLPLRGIMFALKPIIGSLRVLKYLAGGLAGLAGLGLGGGGSGKGPKGRGGPRGSRSFSLGRLGALVPGVAALMTGVEVIKAGGEAVKGREREFKKGEIGHWLGVGKRETDYGDYTQSPTGRGGRRRRVPGGMEDALLGNAGLINDHYGNKFATGSQKFNSMLNGMDNPKVSNTGGDAKMLEVLGMMARQREGVQQVTVTNPSPPSNVSVTVNVTTNASPAEIGSAVGAQVSGALRQNLADGGE